ncbi:MAG TPA: FkbM family methyltransferase [bacterium]|nr:FkbM family methyltransferase [bacterium]
MNKWKFYTEYIKSISKHYQNWLEIATKRILKKDLNKLILKSGKIINMKSNQEYPLAKLLEVGWVIKESDNDYVTLCKDECFICRLNSGYDISHLTELYINKVYGDHFQGVVVDVGASNGDSSIFFAKRGADMVIALEPMPESYQLAMKNVEINGLKHKVKLVNAALFTERGKTKFKVSTKNPNANSISPTRQVIDLGITYDNEVEVETLSLQDIVKDFSLNNVSLLKMDCEGCEYYIFNDVDQLILDKIEEVILEFHEGPKGIPSLLSKNGFSVRYTGSGIGMLYAKKNK